MSHGEPDRAARPRQVRSGAQRGRLRVRGTPQRVTGVSFILIDAPPGSGPKLHKHPHEEVFVVQEGEVTFTAARRVSRLP
jgi:quercetin dioxygenase-like cupin family protein